MKKIDYLLVPCFMVLSFGSIAQTKLTHESLALAQHNFKTSGSLDQATYHPFLNNSRWSTASQGFEGYINSVFTIVKDTTFNGFTYSKVVEKYVGIMGIPNNRVNWTGVQIVHFIREDIPNKKVYQYFRFTGDVLIYDFSLEVGATLPGYSEYELKTVDLVEGPDGLRKRFIFKHNTYDDVQVIWIEGIGNISNPFISYAAMRDWQKLICASQNGIRTYQFVNKDGITCNSFDQATGIEDKDPVLSASLYPNPTNGVFRIVLNKQVAGKKTIRITDVNGKPVFMKDILEGLDYLDADLSALPDGLYFCLISAGGKTVGLKIIKR